MLQRYVMYLVLTLIGLFSVAAWAADENMDSSVYLTFDPVTGEFTSATKELSDTNQFVDTGIQHGQPIPESVPAPAQVVNTEQPSPVRAEQADNETSLWLSGGAVVLILLGIIGFRMRKDQQKSTI